MINKFDELVTEKVAELAFFDELNKYASKMPNKKLVRKILQVGVGGGLLGYAGSLALKNKDVELPHIAGWRQEAAERDELLKTLRDIAPGEFE